MCTLNYLQLDALEHDLQDVFEDGGLTEILCNLNRKDKIKEFLELINCENLLGGEHYSSYRNKYGKILVLGEADVKENVLYGIAKSLNIDPERLELKLGYDFAKRFNISNLQYSDKYSVILVGPMPHKTVSSNGFSSAIAAMEQGEGYPTVIRLGQNSELKITKSGFRKCIKSCLDTNLIAA